MEAKEQQVMDLFRKAARLDQAQQLKDAFIAYTECMTGLLELEKETSDQEAKDRIQQLIEEITDRIEEIKSIVDAENKLEVDVAEQSKEAEEHIKCNVRFNVEDVKVYRVLGSVKELVSEGSLQLLGSPSSEGVLFVRVGQHFMFALTNKIPCLSPAPGYYIIPVQQDYFYGVIFPPNLPAAYVEVFDSIVGQYCVLRRPSSYPKQSPAIVHPTQASIALGKVAESIENTSNKIATSIQNSQHILLAGVELGGEYLKSKLDPADRPLQVNSAIATTVHVASAAAPVVLGVSKSVIGNVLKVAQTIGTTVGSTISKVEFLNKASNSPTAQALSDVGKTSLAAFVNIWDSLDEAGKNLLTSVRTTAVDVVDYKYGKEASDLVDEGLTATTNILETAYTVRKMGLKRLVRAVGAETVKVTVKTAADSPPTPHITVKDVTTVTSLPAAPDYVLHSTTEQEPIKETETTSNVEPTTTTDTEPMTDAEPAKQ